jgi:protein-S-isoprenylcysteine O-methyltransferase Ste14
LRTYFYCLLFMALLHSFEKSGNTLFKYRGQIPVLLFFLAVPVIYFTKYDQIEEPVQIGLTVVSLLLSIIGFVIRAYAIGTTPKGTSGRNTEEQVAESLNKTGIYSSLRHPLYLGNFLIWIGIVVFTFNIYFVVIVSLAFWLYYERIMFAEERFLERKFGEDYLSWSEKVPAFIPDFKNYIKGNIPFSFKSVLRREYSGLLAIVAGFAFVDHLRFYVLNHSFSLWRISTYAVIACAVVAFMLRTLKHQTKLLNEEGRW